MDDVFIRLVTFPSLTTESACVTDPDGNYNIYIDERLSDETKKRKLEHELTHAKQNHFADDIVVSDIEEKLRKKYG